MRAVEASWWRREEPIPVKALLSPLLVAEGAFRAGVALRGLLYDRGLAAAYRPGAPVISVGNLAVGGAGKTPVCLALGARLLARGRRVAVLSRGYGAARADARVVSDGERVLLGAREGGDEPVLLARRLPGARVLCGPRRAELARRAVGALGADALLLDDGFQHRALARDLDVVVIDAGNPTGNGHLLPRGPNREPPGALGRAGLVWFTRVDEARQADPELARLRARARAATGREPVESRHAPAGVLDGTLSRSTDPGWLAGRKVLLLAGLARPESFRRTARALGAHLAAERIFADHHRFTEGEIDEALDAADRAGCDAVLTTEKDAVRLPSSRAGDDRIRVVRIEIEILSGGDALEAALDEALNTPRRPPSP